MRFTGCDSYRVLRDPLGRPKTDRTRIISFQIIVGQVSIPDLPLVPIGKNSAANEYRPTTITLLVVGARKVKDNGIYRERLLQSASRPSGTPK